MFFSGLIGSLASGSMTAVWLVLMVVLLIIEGVKLIVKPAEK